MQLSILLTEEETQILDEHLPHHDFVRLKEKLRYSVNTIGAYIPVIGKDEDGELYDMCIDLEKLLT